MQAVLNITGVNRHGWIWPTCWTLSPSGLDYWTNISVLWYWWPTHKTAIIKTHHHTSCGFKNFWGEMCMHVILRWVMPAWDGSLGHMGLSSEVSGSWLTITLIYISFTIYGCVFLATSSWIKYPKLNVIYDPRLFEKKKVWAWALPNFIPKVKDTAKQGTWVA